MSKYEPLSRRLRGHPADEWRASFSEIEDVLGFPLPKSARQHRAWWANEANANHPHKRSWLEHGWETQDVDQAQGLVTFRRGDIAPATVEAVLEPVGEIPAQRLPKTKRARPPTAQLGQPAPRTKSTAQAEPPTTPQDAPAVGNLPAVVETAPKVGPVVLVAGVAAAITVLAGLSVLAFRAWARRD